MVQYETWNYPVIALTRQSNVTSIDRVKFLAEAVAWTKIRMEMQGSSERISEH